MGFAGKWLGGTVAVLALVLLGSFLVPLKERKSTLAPFVYELFDGEPTTQETPEKIRDPSASGLKRGVRVVQRQVAKRRCREYYDAAHLWRVVKHRYPSSLEEMEAPLRPGEKNFANITKDPWGNAYSLEIDGRKLRVWSSGPDAQEGTDDDISYPEIG